MGDLAISFAPYNDKYKNTLHDLIGLGLTPTQARFYLSLLSMGPSTARSISDALRMHKVEVYRHLKELAQMQLVEVLLDVPNKYLAVNPQLALESLRLRLEQKFKSFDEKAERLSAILPKFQASAISQQARPAGTFYRLVVGRRRGTEEATRLYASAQKEILRITTANGLRRVVYSGILDQDARLTQSGITVKMISTIRKENVEEALRCAKAIQLKHLDESQLRLGIVDGAKMLIGAAYNDQDLSDGSPNDVFILTNDQLFTESMRTLFNRLWESASDAIQTIGLLVKS